MQLRAMASMLLGLSKIVRLRNCQDYCICNYRRRSRASFDFLEQLTTGREEVGRQSAATPCRLDRVGGPGRSWWQRQVGDELHSAATPPISGPLPITRPS